MGARLARRRSVFFFGVHFDAFDPEPPTRTRAREAEQRRAAKAARKQRAEMSRAAST